MFELFYREKLGEVPQTNNYSQFFSKCVKINAVFLEIEIRSSISHRVFVTILSF